MSGKQKEVTEDKNGNFHVQLEDFFQISTSTANTSNVIASAQEVERIVEKLTDMRKGHLLIQISSSL